MNMTIQRCETKDLKWSGIFQNLNLVEHSFFFTPPSLFDIWTKKKLHINILASLLTGYQTFPNGGVALLAGKLHDFTLHPFPLESWWTRQPKVVFWTTFSWGSWRNESTNPYRKSYKITKPLVDLNWYLACDFMRFPFVLDTEIEM